MTIYLGRSIHISQTLIDKCIEFINVNSRVVIEIQTGVFNRNDTCLTPHSY